MSGHGLIPTAAEITAVSQLIQQWRTYGSDDFCAIKGYLYQVRNADWNGNPPITDWPVNLVDPDEVIMAAVEHYFLCRCWVGTGVQPAWQVRQLKDIYNFGKILGVTPRHNPNKSPTPFAGVHSHFQELGIKDGVTDLVASGRSAPWFAAPPKYY